MECLVLVALAAHAADVGHLDHLLQVARDGALQLGALLVQRPQARLQRHRVVHLLLHRRAGAAGLGELFRSDEARNVNKELSLVVTPFAAFEFVINIETQDSNCS